MVKIEKKLGEHSRTIRSGKRAGQTVFDTEYVISEDGVFKGKARTMKKAKAFIANGFRHLPMILNQK